MYIIIAVVLLITNEYLNSWRLAFLEEACFTLLAFEES